MNQRQVKKREKRLNNEYWDEFEQQLQAEEGLIAVRRKDQLKEETIGECSVLEFQTQALENWQFFATLEDGLTLYAQPSNWLNEFNPSTCFFKWQGDADAFSLKEWRKWTKVIREVPLKAKVQAITLKKRLSEQQAKDWWSSFKAREQEVAEQDQDVLMEVKDYIRMLPYQSKQLESVTLLDAIQVGEGVEWRTYPIYQLPIQLVFKSEVSAEEQQRLKEQYQEELTQPIYQSRTYQCQII